MALFPSTYTASPTPQMRCTPLLNFQEEAPKPMAFFRIGAALNYTVATWSNLHRSPQLIFSCQGCPWGNRLFGKFTHRDGKGRANGLRLGIVFLMWPLGGLLSSVETIFVVFSVLGLKPVFAFGP
ncbi:hypothetical protein JZ751_002232, partial [Albula glossodonta]